MKNEFNELQNLVISVEERTINDAAKLKRSLADIIQTINKMMEESTSAYITINYSHIRNMMSAYKLSKSLADIEAFIKQIYSAKGYKVSDSRQNSFIISWKAD